MVVTSDGGASSESVTNSPEKNVNAELGGSAAMLHGGDFLAHSLYYLNFYLRFMMFYSLAQLIFFSIPENGISSPVKSHQATFKSGDSHGIEPLVD